MSSIRHVCPHVLCGGTSTDDSGRLIIMVCFSVDCGVFFTQGDCTNCDFGFVVVHTSDTPIPYHYVAIATRTQY